MTSAPPPAAARPDPASAGPVPMVRVGAHLFRGHGLGNDYLVVDALPPASPAEGWFLTPEAVRRLCARGAGVGSDGVVVLLDDAPEGDAPFPVRMFNPDGSEFERSGNGLRVLGAALHARGRVGEAPFHVLSGGSVIRMEVHGVAPGGRRDLSVAMGTATAGAEAAAAVGWRGQAGEGQAGEDEAGAGEAGSPRFALALPGVGEVHLVPVWVGNPHAVVFIDAENPELVGDQDPGDIDLDGPLLRRVGPLLATHPAFARGTNVQLARVRGGEVEIGIWERGVGRTPASGTSSCAAAVAAVATGRRAPGAIRVRMPGGTLQVAVTRELEVTLRGPVQEVLTGTLSPGFMGWLGEPPVSP